MSASEALAAQQTAPEQDRQSFRYISDFEEAATAYRAVSKYQPDHRLLEEGPLDYSNITLYQAMRDATFNKDDMAAYGFWDTDVDVIDSSLEKVFQDKDSQDWQSAGRMLGYVVPPEPKPQAMVTVLEFSPDDTVEIAPVELLQAPKSHSGSGIILGETVELESYRGLATVWHVTSDLLGELDIDHNPTLENIEAVIDNSDPFEEGSWTFEGEDSNLIKQALIMAAERNETIQDAAARYALQHVA